MTDYVIGSKVVHPCYGAGTVIRIQEKSIGETAHAYYVIHTATRSMQLMVPVEKANSLGLRDVGNPLELRGLLDGCAQDPPEAQIGSDLRTRQARMRERLKSGCFADVIDVVAKLYIMNSRRPLGTMDRQLLDQGKELLASELALASSVDVSAAMEELEGVFVRMASLLDG